MKVTPQFEARTVVFLVVAAMVVASAIVGGTSPPTTAKPNSQKKTGKPSGACHVNWGGGGQFKPTSEKYE